MMHALSYLMQIDIAEDVDPAEKKGVKEALRERHSLPVEKVLGQQQPKNHRDPMGRDDNENPLMINRRVDCEGDDARGDRPEK